MQYLGATYYNIGPFYEKKISVVFQKGKFVVKGPIGKGKSFLFFDGPLSALYKNTGRTIKNVKAKQGFVKLFFKDKEGKTFFIKRIIKSSKKGSDSIESQLFVVENVECLEQILLQIENIVIPEIDIEEMFLLANGRLSLIEFKNETDLQKNLEQMLPEKDVFIHTTILLQDAENIFDITPAQRMNVLKNIFGLLSIDQAKSIIDDNKRELATEIKIKNDFSLFDKKNREYRTILLSSRNFLKQTEYATYFNQKVFSIFDSYAQIISSLTIENQKSDSFDLNDFLILENKLLENQKKYDEQNHQLSFLHQQIDSLNNKSLQLQNEENDIQKKISYLKSSISNITIVDIEQLQKQKNQLIETAMNLEKQIPFDLVQTFNSELKKLSDLVDWIQSLLDEGKDIKNQIEILTLKVQSRKQEKKAIELMIEQLELKIGTEGYQQFIKETNFYLDNNHQQIETLYFQKKNIQEKEKNFQQLLQNYKNRIDESEKALLLQQQFFCSKIEGDCPFINQINESTISRLEQQKKEIQSQYQQCLNDYSGSNFDDKYKEIDLKIKILEDEKKVLQENPIQSPLLKTFIEDNLLKVSELKKQLSGFSDLDLLDKDLISYNEKINEIKNILHVISYKNILDVYTSIKKIYEEKNMIQEKIDSNEKFIHQIQQDKMLLKEQEISLSNIQKQRSVLNQDITQIDMQKKTINDNLISQNLQEQKQILDQILIIKDYKNKIDLLLHDAQVIKYDIKQKIGKLERLSELQNVFGKELLLIVLQESLPLLTEIINNFLSKIVDYSLKFEIFKTESSFELDMKIIDSHGERSVKSLSGGQRIVLRLCWILAVSMIGKNSMLFLDETINHLDHDTVGKVSELLEDFIKSHDLSFYVITHSQQVQEIPIRDNVIELTV